MSASSAYPPPPTYEEQVNIEPNAVNYPPSAPSCPIQPSSSVQYKELENNPVHPLPHNQYQGPMNYPTSNPMQPEYHQGPMNYPTSSHPMQPEYQEPMNYPTSNPMQPVPHNQYQGPMNFPTSNPMQPNQCTQYMDEVRYIPQPGYAPPQQPTTATMFGGPSPHYPVALVTRPYGHAPELCRTFIAPIFLAAGVFLLCGCLFGFVAFILAGIGNSHAAIGKNDSAIRLRKASYILSIVGFIIGIIVIITVIVLK